MAVPPTLTPADSWIGQSFTLERTPTASQQRKLSRRIWQTGVGQESLRTPYAVCQPSLVIDMLVVGSFGSNRVNEIAPTNTIRKS